MFKWTIEIKCDQNVLGEHLPHSCPLLVFSTHWTIKVVGKENVHHGLLNYCSVSANSTCQEMFHMKNSNNLRGIYKV